jgi:hypothetical protein
MLSDKWPANFALPSVNRRCIWLSASQKTNAMIIWSMFDRPPENEPITELGNETDAPGHRFHVAGFDAVGRTPTGAVPPYPGLPPG